ncbi:MAG TPA: serine/threonine-protein kinase [Lacunisphaera sp.]|nr:serine/threonine-protein kinase [Lacunisphaera sp.]
MNSTAQREEDLFDEARRLRDSAARREFLARACAGDDAMRTRIEGLLEAELEAELFFTESRPALSLPLVTLTATRGGTTSLGAPSTTVPGEEPVGTRIGRYKLLEKIGEGGWGVVYLAGQEEPVQRRVALKIIKLGMETRSVIARFEAERQALAMMDHPNIARVYDAGATDRGPPYFVMELVRGVKITTYCDQHRLGLRARLDLFIQVCHAIQHAHQKGIIHGDIKPSNIMVAQQDGVAVPKVIDFGISKATEARLTDRLLFTSYAQLIGTPAYMSPEQADINGLDTDTRSDIYSLGVLLYELLTGTTPFDAKQLLESGLDEMRRTLREKEPARPSTRLTTLEGAELARTAGERQVEPHRLCAELHGDLDWIVMKALEKDRGRRYETANGLALDIQRHLNNEPVMARPPSRLYRFRKLVRRNRGVFAAGGAVAAALVIGLGTSTWLFLKEREAHQRAVAAEQQQVRLRHEAEGREKTSQAALLVSQERFEEADKLVMEIPLGHPTLEGATVLRSVAEWHALRLQWKPAADRMALLLQVDQLDGSDVSALDHLRAGPVFIELGDTNSYERFRQGAIARFSSAPCPFADRIVKISLLLPANDRLLDSLKPLAEQTTRALAEADRGGDVFTAAWRSVSLGLLEYRRGNFQKAADWCQRCLDYPGTNAPRTATAQVILAMSYHRLGRAAEARAELAAGREIIEHKFQTRLNGGGPVQGFWFDWLFARILLRESIALLESSPRV